jgi:hypothetical protein
MPSPPKKNPPLRRHLILKNKSLVCGRDCREKNGRGAINAETKAACGEKSVLIKEIERIWRVTSALSVCCGRRRRRRLSHGRSLSHKYKQFMQMHLYVRARLKDEMNI